VKKRITRFVLACACLFATTSSLRAQSSATTGTDKVSFVRAGVFLGRSGSAIGPTLYVEVNPLRWLGVCAVAAQSQSTSSESGGVAHDWDFSTGFCVTAHAPAVRGFVISPFVQVGYQNNHERFAMRLADGDLYRDGDNQRGRQWLVGPMIDRAIVENGPRLAVRVGRNFGKGPASQNADGVYAVAGVILPLDHPVQLARSFRRMTGWKPAETGSAGDH